MISRSRLLNEALVTKKVTRQGPTYVFKNPAGPPVGAKEIDKFIWSAAQSFDLTPIIFGDQLQARLVANDFVAFLSKQAKLHNVPFEEVKSRLKRIGPYARRSLVAFQRHVENELKRK